MARPSAASPKSNRRCVSLPGVLEPVLQQRWEEFRYPGFSPYALELICFDMRKRRAHDLTLPFAEEPRDLQMAFDRLLVRYYAPGREAKGLLVKLILGEEIGLGSSIPRGDYTQFRSHVWFSDTLAPCIETRCEELGYPSFSAYVTAVIRYDLLLLGPHKYFSGDDKSPELMEALDRETAATFQAAIPQATYVDRLLDKAAGRRLSDEERAHALAHVVAQLRELALG